MGWNGSTILEQLATGPKLSRQLSASLGLGVDAIHSTCRILRRKGLLSAYRGLFQITDAGRQALASGVEVKSGPGKGRSPARGRGTLRAKAWRAMRMLGGFSLDDLLTMLCDGSQPSAAANLADYLRALDGAGFLLKLPRRGNGTHPQRYRLRRDRDTGPEAPAWNKPERTLTDPNTGEVFRVPRRSELAQQGAAHDA